MDNALQVREIKLEDRSANKNITLQSLGFLIMFVMLGAGLTSHFILNEKKDRTYHRILSGPVNARQYVTANIFTSLAIVALQIVIYPVSFEVPV
jgi:ABC-2 type transport system permease protein